MFRDDFRNKMMGQLSQTTVLGTIKISYNGYTQQQKRAWLQQIYSKGTKELYKLNTLPSDFMTFNTERFPCISTNQRLTQGLGFISKLSKP